MIRAPKGTKDMLPAEAVFWKGFQNTAQEVFGRYGYLPIFTPDIELTELFVRGIGQATDVVSKEMFSAISGGNLAKLVAGEKLSSKSRLSLRPEGTAGIVRAVVEHDLVPQGAPPVKLMYAGPMFRAENVQLGRQRQFNQIGIECLGAEDPETDAEAVIMAIRFFTELGISTDSIRLLVNSMGCEDCRPAYRDEVRKYMEEHRDQLCETCLERMDINPLRAFDCKDQECIAVMSSAPKITDHLCDGCKDHYAQVLELLDIADIPYVQEPTLVRGLDYYTRTVFEIQASDGTGSQNAICGGGRYDKLAEEVGGRPTPGFGFALGYERTKLVLEALGMEISQPIPCQVFVACVEESSRTQAFAIVQRIREAGFKADMDHQGRSLKSQFKLANKLGAHAVAVLGPDELAAGVVTFRNMDEHTEEPVRIDELSERLPQLLNG